MTISFNFSTQAIMKEIYAASALRCITNDPSYRVPPVLTRHSAPALQRLVKDAFAFVVMKFIAHVEACNLNGETASECNDANNGDDMILSVDLRRHFHLNYGVDASDCRACHCGLFAPHRIYRSRRPRFKAIFPNCQR